LEVLLSATNTGVKSTIASRGGDFFRRVKSYWRARGPRAFVLAAFKTIAGPVVRYNRHFIWEALLDTPRLPSPWADDERLSILGPEQLDPALNEPLRRFLGGENVTSDLEGVRHGDRLMLVTIDGKYAYSGYIYFDTTAATRRHVKIYCETPGVPVIGTCASAPAKIWGGPAGVPAQGALRSKLEQLLPSGADLEKAARGFKTMGLFLHTAQLAHNLELPFDALKDRILAGRNLWQAVQDLNSNVDAVAEVRKIWEEASIHRRVLNEAFRYLQQLGYPRVINDVLAHNEASIKANVAVGMRLCRELRDCTILKHLVVQRVGEGGRWRWRLLFT
jgi:hypothetical protein